jgi:hypothetical protein
VSQPSPSAGLDRKTVRKVIASGLEPPVYGPARGWCVELPSALQLVL